MGFALAEQAGQGVLGLGLAETGLVDIVDAGVVDTIPCDLTCVVSIVGIDGIAAEEEAGTVYQAVAAFPFDGVDIVGNVHLAIDERRKRVVEGTSGIVLKVHHGNTVLVAIVEADGTAVAIPERVARTNDETNIVVAEIQAGEGTEHFG